MSGVVIVGLELFCVLLVVRGVLSWFRLTPGSTWDHLRSGATRVTEPVLRPIRQVLPRVPELDLSAMVAFFVITLLVIPVVGRL